MASNFLEKIMKISARLDRNFFSKSPADLTLVLLAIFRFFFLLFDKKICRILIYSITLKKCKNCDILVPFLITFLSVFLVLAIRIQNFLKSELVRLVGFEQKKNFENRTIFIFELRWRPLP